MAILTDMATRPMLAVKTEVITFKLHKALGHAIAKIDVEYCIDRDLHAVCIHFKNGHKVKCFEHEINSPEFHAQCIMLYDLPG
jgi:hypothetical protein